MSSQRGTWSRLPGLEEIGRGGTLDGADAALADLEHEVDRLLTTIRAAMGITPGGG